MALWTDAAMETQEVRERSSIDATPANLPGKIRWFRIDGERSNAINRPLMLQVRGEGERLMIANHPYHFRANLMQIGAHYDGNRWILRPSAGNVRRIVAWLAWWNVLVDDVALELLNAWWNEG